MQYYTRILTLTFASCFAILCAMEKKTGPIVLFESKFEDDLIKLFQNACKEVQEQAITKGIADIHLEEEPPLYAAVRRADLTMIKEIFAAQKQDIIKDGTCGTTALHIAAAENKTEIARLLLDYGANINAQNADGLTPLQKTVNENFLKNRLDTSMISLLLERGAIVTLPDGLSDGNSLLLCALGNPKWIPIFLAHGVSPNLRDGRGRTLLHQFIEASSDIRSSTLIFLVNNGFSVNAQDNFGDSPLFYAIRERKVNLIYMLVQLGANTSLKNLHEETPFSILRNENARISLTWPLNSLDTINVLQQLKSCYEALVSKGVPQ